jgi:hypothetical protein
MFDAWSGYMLPSSFAGEGREKASGEWAP